MRSFARSLYPYFPLLLFGIAVFSVLRLHCIRRCICKRERYFIHIMCWLSGYKFSSSESFDRTCVWVSHNSISTLLNSGIFFIYRAQCVWIRYTREYMNGISYIINVEFIESTPYHLFFPLSRFTTSHRNRYFLFRFCFVLVSISQFQIFLLQRRLHGFFKSFIKRTLSSNNEKKNDQNSLNGQCSIINLPNSCNHKILYEKAYSFKIWISRSLWKVIYEKKKYMIKWLI